MQSYQWLNSQIEKIPEYLSVITEEQVQAHPSTRLIILPGPFVLSTQYHLEERLLSYYYYPFKFNFMMYGLHIINIPVLSVQFEEF